MTKNDVVYINDTVYPIKRGDMRKSISTKLRFEVFKKHGFKCYYCGVPGSKAELQCEHMTPVSRGGKNDINNLVPACAECNSGKRANLLSPTFQGKHIAARLYADRLQIRNIFEEEIEETSDGRVRVSFSLDNVEALTLMRAVLVNEPNASISEMLLQKGRHGHEGLAYWQPIYFLDALYDEDDVMREQRELEGSASDRAFDEVLQGRINIKPRDLVYHDVVSRLRDYIWNIVVKTRSAQKSEGATALSGT